MREEPLAERYARALLAAGQESGATDRVAQDLLLLRALQEELPELLPFLAHPRIDPATKEKVLLSLDASLHPYTLNLLRLLVRKGRASLLPALVSAYFEAWEEVGGPVHVVVRSAQPLSLEERAKLQARLKEALGREVNLEEEVAPELLAGVELVIGGKRLDASLRGRLARLRQVLGGGHAPV